MTHIEGHAGEIMAGLADAIGKSGAKSFEFGYRLDGEDQNREPNPDEPVTWWAVIEMPNGIEYRGECRTTDHIRGGVEAVAEAIRAGGGKVEIEEKKP